MHWRGGEVVEKVPVQFLYVSIAKGLMSLWYIAKELSLLSSSLNDDELSLEVPLLWNIYIRGQ